MRSFIILTLAFSVAVASAAPPSKGGHTQYKWKDASGNVHFADILPAEGLQLGYDVVDAQGRVVKHVDRAKTPEELQADESAASQAAKATHAAEDQAKHDQQILAAYPNEQELASAQQAQLNMIDQNIQATESSLASQEKSLTAILTHAANLERNGKAVPPALQEQIESLRKNIEKQKAYVVRRQQDKIDAAQKSAADLAHYRELQAKAVHPASH